jgi:hypothetical protein
VTDLNRYKLIGLSKKVIIPKALEKQASILNYDEDILYAPPYKGEMLSEIFHPKKKWPDESTFIAQIHATLSHLGLKALAYYHLYSLHIINTHKKSNFRKKALSNAELLLNNARKNRPASPTREVTTSVEMLNHISKSIMNSLGVKDGDQAIVEVSSQKPVEITLIFSTYQTPSHNNKLDFSSSQKNLNAFVHLSNYRPHNMAPHDM